MVAEERANVWCSVVTSRVGHPIGTRSPGIAAAHVSFCLEGEADGWGLWCFRE
jgi:hypothetical protein